MIALTGDALAQAIASLTAEAQGASLTTGRPWRRAYGDPPPMWRSGFEVPVEVLAHVAHTQDKTGEAPCEALIMLAQSVDQASAARYAQAVLDALLGGGPEARDKGALALVATLADPHTLELLYRALRRWAGGRRHQLATLTLHALTEALPHRADPDPALEVLDRVARRLRTRRPAVATVAWRPVQAAADARGCSLETLSDALASRAGFDAEGRQPITTGSAPLLAQLGPDHQITLLRPDGAPAEKPPPGQAQAVKARLHTLDIELEGVLEAARRRLNDALISGRTWALADFKAHLAEHPIIAPLVRRLVLVLLDGRGQPVCGARLNDEGALENHQGQPAPAAERVCLLHPARATAEVIAGWAARLEALGVEPLLDQLARPALKPTEDHPRFEVRQLGLSYAPEALIHAARSAGWRDQLRPGPRWVTCACLYRGPEGFIQAVMAVDQHNQALGPLAFRTLDPAAEDAREAPLPRRSEVDRWLELSEVPPAIYAEAAATVAALGTD